MADPAALPSPPVPSAPGAAGPAFAPGTAVATAFGVFGRHLLAFAAVALVLFAPAAAMQYAVRGDAGWLTSVVGAIVHCFIVAAVTRGSLDALGGTRPGVGRMLGVALTRGFRVVGTALATGLIEALGLVFLVVPGLVAVAGLYVAQPAVVAEDGASPGSSVSRSWALTEGHRWGTLALVLLFQGLSVAVNLATGLLLEGLAAAPRAAWAVWLAGQLVSALTVALYGVAAAVTYHALRAEKEGVEAPALARVFE